jgi:hypothetical protein
MTTIAGKFAGAFCALTVFAITTSPYPSVKVSVIPKTPADVNVFDPVMVVPEIVPVPIVLALVPVFVKVHSAHAHELTLAATPLSVAEKLTGLVIGFT